MTPEEIMDKFFYRKNPFAVKTSKGFYVPVYRDVTLRDIQRHLDGQHTIGAYQSRPDETCTWACIDFDDKKYEEIVGEIVKHIKPFTIFYTDDLPPIVKDVGFEVSTSKGYHVWFHFNRPEKIEFAYKYVMTQLTSRGLYPGRDSKIDIFPRSPHLSGKKVGWLVRIPR